LTWLAPPSTIRTGGQVGFTGNAAGIERGHDAGSCRRPRYRRWGTHVTIRPPRVRIRVLYVISTLDVGGTEGQLVHLARRLDRGRFDVTVCCLGPAGPLVAALEEAAVSVWVIGLRRETAWRRPVDTARRLWRLLALARAWRPHIVHGLLFHGYVAGAVLGTLTGAPVVVASRRSLGHSRSRTPHYRVVGWLANRLTTLVIANSEAVREQVLRQERLSADLVAVVHNGIDMRAVESPPEELVRELRRGLALDGRWPIVGVVANLIAYKGLQYFLPAWATVVAKHQKAVALLVGDGPLRGTLEAQARALGLGDTVRFLGYRADVPALLGLMDLVVQPSLEEGFSNAVLEAMGAGKPVVATAVGGTPEAVIDGLTGLLVPARDAVSLAGAMLDVIGSSAESQRLGEAAYRRAREQFEVDVMVRRYEELYAEAFDSQGNDVAGSSDARAPRARP
jgi:glycosyltransferase involved in cell wall biosynthesis